MNLIKIFLQQRKLSPKQREFVKTKVLEDTRKLKYWLEFLERVSGYDQIVNKALREITIFKIIVFVVGFVLLMPDDYTIKGLGYFVILFGFIVWIIKGMLRRRFDLDDAITYFLLKIVYAFKEETDEKTRLKLKIDLTKPCKKKYLVEKKRLPPRGRTKFILNEIYKKPVFEGTITFLDGLVLDFEVILIHVHSFREKRSISGKRKTKTKYKNTTKFVFKVMVPKNRYEIWDNQHLVGEDDKYYIMKFTRKEKRTYHRHSTKIADPKEFLAQIGRIYRILQKVA